MEKVVLTRGRYEDNFILNFLTMEVLRSITICCHKGEYRFYNENFKGLVKNIKEYEGDNVAAARQWVIEDSKEDKILFIEDNISLFVRGVHPRFGDKNSSELYKLDDTRFNENDINKYMYKLFDKIESKLSLDDFAIVGISARGGNNNVKEEFTENSRLYGFWAVDKKKYNKIKENIDDVKYREDFYIMLCFIKNVYKIGIFYDYCFDKYRKQEETNKNALFLSNKFKPFVSTSINEKKTWNGYTGAIIDVKVQWKKMYNYYKGIRDSLTLF